jgi:ABC-type sugar transport system ATPase subunit
MMEIRGLTKRFGDVTAIAGIDLTVGERELCVLLGPSGCGKSTALRCVAGLEKPDSGEILIGGRRVNELEPKDRNVAMVFQSYALYPHMSVRENIAFPLRMRKAEDIDRRVVDAAKLLKIEGLLDRRPRELSGGQRQRVAIGRAIVREPSLFLFDEPLSNLDAKLRAEMRMEIAALHKRLGAAILYVTHDQVEAMTLGSRIAVLSEGRIEQVGTPEEVYERPATRFVAGFVGTPRMNFIEGRIEGGAFSAQGVSVAVDAPDGPAELGVRPEDIGIGGDIEGHVEWIENLGSDRYAHVRCGESRLVMRLPAGAAPEENVKLAFGGAIHLFRDGKRI